MEKCILLTENILRMDNFANIRLTAIKVMPSTPSVRVIAKQTRLYYVLPIQTPFQPRHRITNSTLRILHISPQYCCTFVLLSSRAVTLVGKGVFSSISSRCRIFYISTLRSLVQPRPGSPPSPATDPQCSSRPARKATPTCRRAHLHDEQARFWEGFIVDQHVQRKKCWVNGDLYHLHFQPKAA